MTITLPDDIVGALRASDPDLSRAIVRLAETAGSKLAPRPAVELARYGRSAVIVLVPNKAVGRMPGVELVPLPDGRALISLDKDTRIAEFEVLVRDTLESEGTAAPDRAALKILGDILRSARQSRNVRLSERNIIVLETTTRPPIARNVARRGNG